MISYVRLVQQGKGARQFNDMTESRSQWPRGVRSGSVAVRLLELRILIPSGAWTPVFCGLCVCYWVEVSVKGRSLVQMGPTECGVSN